MHRFDIRAVKSRKEWRMFLHLPWAVYSGDPHWVPPLLFDVKRQLNERLNPFFQQAKVQYWIAVDHSGKCLGRIAAIVNHRHNRHYHDQVGFFGYFESVDHAPVATALWDTASDWLRSEGMDTIRGPVNLSLTNESGLMIDGFNRPPVLQMSYNPPYYQQMMEQYGFEKAHDLLAYYVDDRILRNKPVMDRLSRLAGIVAEKDHITFRYFDARNFKQDIANIRILFNDYMSDNWGFLPMDESEIDFMATLLKPLLINELAIFAEVNGKPVGFSLALPDFNQVLKRMNGRLFPTGIFKYLLYKNKISDIRVILLGISAPYRRKGLEAMFYYKTIIEGAKRKFTGAELSWLSEENIMLMRALEHLGATMYKRYRVYQKSLQ